MKRFIYFAAIACIALAGCTKNEATVVEGNSDQLISFASPVVGLATKANVGYPNNRPFWVVGRVHSGNYSGWATSQPYMEATCSYSATPNKAYYPSPVYYWPKNDSYKLTFVAYSPAKTSFAGTPTVTFGDTGFAISNYTVIDSYTPNQDLLVSRVTYNQTKPGAGTTAEITDPYKYEGVNIQFEHALSSINFKVKTSDDYSATTEIKLTTITLNKINNVGTFAQNLNLTVNSDVVGPGATFTPTWSSTSGAAEYRPLTGGDITVTDTPAVVGTELILLPQELVASLQTATITYTMQSKIDGTLVGTPIPYTKTINLNNTTTEEWQAKKKYTYTIVIGLDVMYFAPEVIDWTTADAGLLTI